MNWNIDDICDVAEGGQGRVEEQGVEAALVCFVHEADRAIDGGHDHKQSLVKAPGDETEGRAVVRVNDDKEGPS